MAEFWVMVVLVAITLYVLLDGFDLGVGILFAAVRDEPRRRRMLDAISPVWDGNETWLVMTGAVLFGAFPVVYSVVLSAFYLPICIMLACLILRGVAFEFRQHAVHLKWLWDGGFMAGSVLATFIQGCAIGAIAQGLPVQAGQYVGSTFAWVTPFSILCGVGLTTGYAALGAAWLIHKCDGDVQTFAKRVFPYLMVATFAALCLVFSFAIAEDEPVLHRWDVLSWRYVFPAVALVATGCLLFIKRKRRDVRPLLLTMVIFLCGIGALVASFWPWMIPFSITVHDAQSPPSSLSFMFWGIGILAFPLTLGYTLVNYFVFRGKSRLANEY
ncbi:cytochrome d ubiquinol oxidase subunit II [Luteibacter sp. W1I16]|uniref:cytochrome d ubiquinol oxidase subunit II n=1 Tax=Luteibacter sp. W1I16 TaxID=3373922 RepID=UPI003D1BC978